MSELPQILKKYLSNEKLKFLSEELIEISKNTKVLTQRTKNSNNVVLITGPSGAGKDTVVNSLPENKFVRWRTWTTRKEIRADEQDNDPYVRATKEEFEEQIAAGEFIEFNEYGGNLYGTHIREARTAFEDGRIPVLRIDPRGALRFNELFAKEEPPFNGTNLHHFFVCPPTLDDLLGRLQKRDSDPEKVDKRYKIALSDLPFIVYAQYLLINRNGEVLDAVSALTSHLESLPASSADGQP